MSMNPEDITAYYSESGSTSCAAVRSSAFNSGKSGLLNEETLSLIGLPKYLEDMEVYPSEGFVLLNPADVDVESSSAALFKCSLEFLVLEIYIGASAPDDLKTCRSWSCQGFPARRVT